MHKGHLYQTNEKTSAKHCVKDHDVGNSRPTCLKCMVYFTVLVTRCRLIMNTAEHRRCNPDYHSPQKRIQELLKKGDGCQGPPRKGYKNFQTDNFKLIN